MEFHFCLSSFPVYCLISVRIFVPRRQSVLPAYGMRDKTIAFFVSDIWNCNSLLWNTVHVPSTGNTLPLSSQRRFCFLFDPWQLILLPQHRSGPWSFEFSSSDQYEVSQQFFFIVESLVLHCFVQLRDHTRPSQFEVEMNSVMLTFFILPWSRLKEFRILLVLHDPIVHRNLGRRSFCKLIVNKSAIPCTAS